MLKLMSYQFTGSVWDRRRREKKEPAPPNWNDIYMKGIASIYLSKTHLLRKVCMERLCVVSYFIHIASVCRYRFLLLFFFIWLIYVSFSYIGHREFVQLLFFMCSFFFIIVGEGRLWNEERVFFLCWNT